MTRHANLAILSKMASTAPEQMIELSMFRRLTFIELKSGPRPATGSGHFVDFDERFVDFLTMLSRKARGSDIKA